jgi:hypothetical protein
MCGTDVRDNGVSAAPEDRLRGPQTEDPPQRPQSSERRAEALLSVASVLLLASFFAAPKEKQILRYAQDDMSF